MNPQELQQFFSQLPEELKQKVMMLPTEEERMMVVAKLYEKYMMQSGGMGAQEQTQPAMMTEEMPMGRYGYQARYGYRAQDGMSSPQKVPVEAERNENITVPQGEATPQTRGGYLKEKSYNPISGQTTYEIPDNQHNNTHEEVDIHTGETGVNMELPEGSVVNSDKTKIPGDFYIGKSNYKGKTFKDASDRLSALEKKANEKLKILKQAGEADDITETSFAMNFAKYAKLRHELNKYQEAVLDLKNYKESKEETQFLLSRYGKTVSKYQKAQYGLNVAMDNYIQDKPGFKTGKQVLKAAKGLEATLKGVDALMADMQGQDLSIEDLTSRAKIYGLMDEGLGGVSEQMPSRQAPGQPFVFNPNESKIKQFKDAIFSTESSAYKNPYLAISGLRESDVINKTFDELKSRAASTATGKYQFIEAHLPDIRRVTGVKSMEEFRRNPEAQEAFMDWHIQNNLMPTAIKLKQKYNMPFNIYQIMAGLHLEGEGKPYKQGDKKPVGFLGKFMANQLDAATKAANNFKNPSPQKYMSLFANFEDDETAQQPMRYGGTAMYPEGGTITPAQRKQQEIEERAKRMMKADSLNFAEFFKDKGRLKNYKETDWNVAVDSITPDKKIFGREYISPDIRRRTFYYPDAPKTPIQVVPGIIEDPNFRYGGDVYMAKGGLIKRKDGSYSQRGLWDNIRANRGSGKKPTAEMLRQERKIRAQEARDGLYINPETATQFGGTVDKNPVVMNQLLFDSLPSDVKFNIAQQMEMGGCVDCGEYPVFAEGGKWIQKAIKHPGRCTPGSPNYDCPKGSPQWNLAQRFKHGDLHRKEYGGYTSTTHIPKFTYQESFRMEDDNDQYFPKKKYMYGNKVIADKGVSNLDYTFKELSQFKNNPITQDNFKSKYPTYETWLTDLNSRIKSDPDFINKATVAFNKAKNTNLTQQQFEEYIKDKEVGTVTDFAANFLNESASAPQPQSGGTPFSGLGLGTPGRRFYGEGDNNKMSLKFNPVTGKMEYNPLVKLPKFNIPPYGNQGTEFSRLLAGASQEDTADSSPASTTSSLSEEEKADIEEKIPFGKKLNYYTNQMLPAIDALALMMERPIPPTLQQKRARYTPTRTDVDINPQLNEMDRMYATLQEDTRGNPAVRAARLAQMASNMTQGKNEVLANQYNLENQLYNQEVMRKDQYFNQLDDVNRQLMKQYEVERLQTEENRRQQSNQARQFLMNMPLRKAEQDKALALATMNTIYDYDPISQTFVRNPERAEQAVLLEIQKKKIEQILEEKQKEVEELKALKLTGANTKANEERIQELENQLTQLTKSQNSKPKRYGGTITSPAQKRKDANIQKNLNPGMSYRKYFPTY